MLRFNGWEVVDHRYASGTETFGFYEDGTTTTVVAGSLWVKLRHIDGREYEMLIKNPSEFFRLSEEGTPLWEAKRPE